MSEKSQTIRDFFVSRTSQILQTKENSKSLISPFVWDNRSWHIPHFCNDRWLFLTNLFKFVLSGTSAVDSTHYQYSKLLHFSPPIIHKHGIDTVIWTSPHFGHPHSQNPSDIGIACNPNPNPKRQGNMRKGCPYH